MPEEQLKVDITGDASGLEQASKKAASALNTVSKAATTTGVALDKVPQISAKVSTAAGAMAGNIGKAGGAVVKTKKDFTAFAHV